MKHHAGKISVICLLLLAALLSLSSCSLTDALVSGTGIKDDPDYVRYKQLSDNGKLDGEGRYTADAVHVTFALNSRLKATYYSDAAFRRKIDTTDCYLMPGDRIYAIVEIDSDAGTNMYTFDRFRIIEYTDSGKKGAELDWYSGEGNLVFMLPGDYTGTEIAVEPIGRFSKRKLSFREIVTAEGTDGKTRAVGKWTVNNADVTGDSYEIDPTESYYVRYHYAPGDYRFVSSEPASYYQDNNTGYVYFDMISATEETPEFSVTLEPWNRKADLHINLHSSIGEGTDVRVSTDNAETEWLSYKGQLLQFNHEYTILDEKNMNIGQDITFDMKNLSFTEKNNTVRMDIRMTRTGDNKVTSDTAYFTDPEQPMVYRIFRDIDTDYSRIEIVLRAVQMDGYSPVRSARALVELFRGDTTDEPVAEGKAFQPTDRVTVRISPRDGYYLTGANVKDGVYTCSCAYGDWKTVTLKALEQQVGKLIRVELNPECAYGTCTWQVDAQPVSGTQALKNGQRITVRLELAGENADKYVITNGTDILTGIGNLFTGNGGKVFEISFEAGSDLDGKTLNVLDYITVKEKE